LVSQTLVFALEKQQQVEEILMGEVVFFFVEVGAALPLAGQIKKAEARLLSVEETRISDRNDKNIF